MLERRCRREPLAHILGYREFWGRRFEVSSATLIPRPETERIVEMALEWLDQVVYTHRPLIDEELLGLTTALKNGEGGSDVLRGGHAPLLQARFRGIDIGTGTGALAVSLLVERADLAMVATDVDLVAIRMARRNAQQHGVSDRLRLVACDLASALTHRFDLVVANLPYVPSSEIDTLQPEIATWEPRLALDGGPDGTSLIAGLLSTLPRLLAPGGLALVEIGERQSEHLVNVARERSVLDVRVERDAAGTDRFLAITHPVL
jgi:release factor glutamine methyltransferase